MAKHQQHCRRSSGVAALELFLLMPIFILMLSLPLYMGRYCYHYSVAHVAATNAATYMSRIPLGEMTNTSRAPEAISVAREMIMEMTSELNPGKLKPTLLMSCDDYVCSGYVRPQVVRVSIDMQVQDIFFPKSTQLRLPLRVSITLPYQGR